MSNFASDCVIGRYWSVARPLLWLIVGLITPFLVTGGIVLTWKLCAMHKGRDFIYFSTFVQLTLHVVLYISYFGLTNLAVKMFHCVSVFDSLDYFSGSQTKVLADDTSVQCWEGVHWALIAISLLVIFVFVIGFPVYCVLRIHRQKQLEMTSHAELMPSIRDTLEFLHWPYAEKYYYWEILVFEIGRASCRERV